MISLKIYITVHIQYCFVTESSNMDNQLAAQDATPSFRRLKSMTTVGADSSSHMLVAVTQLLDTKLSIDWVELTVNSRGTSTVILSRLHSVQEYMIEKCMLIHFLFIGKKIVQLVVPGVNLYYIKKPYDSTFMSLILGH